MAKTYTLADQETKTNFEAEARRRANTRSWSCALQIGPGSMKRYCRPVEVSVTVRLWRDSPGAVIDKKGTPSSRIKPANLSPVSPPKATSARLSPPKAAMARLTFKPPPPGSSEGAVQRSLVSGISATRSLARSSAGFRVRVTMGVCKSARLYGLIAMAV